MFCCCGLLESGMPELRGKITLPLPSFGLWAHGQNWHHPLAMLHAFVPGTSATIFAIWLCTRGFYRSSNQLIKCAELILSVHVSAHVLRYVDSIKCDEGGRNVYYLWCSEQRTYLCPWDVQSCHVHINIHLFCMSCFMSSFWTQHHSCLLPVYLFFDPMSEFVSLSS